VSLRTSSGVNLSTIGSAVISTSPIVHRIFIWENSQALRLRLRLRSPFGLIVKRLWVTMLVSKPEVRKTKLEHPDSIHESRYEIRQRKTAFSIKRYGHLYRYRRLHLLRTSALTFTKRVLLRRLIRSLKDWHSMIPGRRRQLRLKRFLKKRKGFLFVFVKEDSRQPERFFWAKIQHNIFYVHPLSSSNHFLIIDFEGRVPLDFTFPLMMRAGGGRMPYWAIRLGSVM